MRASVFSLFLVLAATACGAADHNVPPPPEHHAAEANSDAAVAALRASKFADARQAATAALGRDPRDSRAAAVRALASYQIAAHDLFGELENIIGRADHLEFFDHKGGREAWQRWLNVLEGVQNDLEVSAADTQFSLEMCLACWEVDWNRNGRIDERDGHMLEIEVDGKGETLPEGDPRRRPVFRFDQGDAEWALAMVSFQRAAGELVLAYKWSELDKLFSQEHPAITIKLTEPERVVRARKLILEGLAHADKCRTEYLSETDDDREWVPNPTQKNHAIPLAMDASIYSTWEGVIGDMRRMLNSEEGLSMRDLTQVVDENAELTSKVPSAYIDIGRMLKEPQDIQINVAMLMFADKNLNVAEKVLRDLIGNGYQTSMKPSPLPSRLRAMKKQLDTGEDTFDRKLHYLFWLN
ncbi:MAG TPA: hypothetical protein VGM90_36125 [Kofleriaceae bacterium]|jgi:hypothetical protein